MRYSIAIKVYHMRSKKTRKTADFEPLLNLIKLLKLGPNTMAIKRKTYKIRNGDVIYVEEYHDGNYGAPGKKRAKKEKPTKEQMQIINSLNKSRRARLRMLQYFKPGDLFVTWTYSERNRPVSMEAALEDFQKVIRIIRREYKKRGYELFWIRNIERGTKGAWHIHLILNEIGDTTNIVKQVWPYGYIKVIELKDHEEYDDDFTRMSNYITKDENTPSKRKDGKPGKPRLKDANYNTSRNMPLPEPDKDKLLRWKPEPKPKKGYYIVKEENASNHEGINKLGFRYRRYTMIRIRSKFDEERKAANRARNVRGKP